MDSFLMAAMSVTDFIGYLTTIGKTAAGLGFVIFIHELGHFLAAKACGVKCEKFYVGFDPPIKLFGFPLPRTLGKFRWGETEYGIGIIPLGGYVKMLGQDDDPRLASQEAELERIRNPKEDEAGEAKEDQPAEGQRLESPNADIPLDPRSFPAKTVPQRMIIISAGVLMNLISAVFLAATAYGLGVAFMPCEFSGATPGDPAWVANIQPGDKLIQIGKQGVPDENLRFSWELRQRVAFAGVSGDKKPMDLLIRKHDGSEVWVSVKPSLRVSEFGTLGVHSPASNRIFLDKSMPLVGAASAAEPPFLNGDLVVAINGVPLDASSKNSKGEIRSEEIESLLVENRGQAVRLTVERTDKEKQTTTLEIVVPPAKYLDTGLRMNMGPIVALQIGGPAEAAGVKVGDTILAIDGNPIDNPCTLPMLVGDVSDRNVTLMLQRGEGEGAEQLEVVIEPKKPQFWEAHDASRPGAFCELSTLGLAYAVPLKVAQVVPGSPADKAGMKAGDKLSKGRYVTDDEALKKQFSGKSFDITPEKENWVILDSMMQGLPKGVQLEITYERGSASGVAKLDTTPIDVYYVGRGIPFARFERNHVASSAGEALSLGWRETREKLTEVVSFLGLLFRGKISPTNLGGPVRIAQLAGREASVSIARLLLFLTFLSCNLAIVNFLPIPALDGGHMVFLIWEGVTGRPPNERVQMTATLVGFVFLLSVMMFVVGNDVFQSFR